MLSKLGLYRHNKRWWFKYRVGKWTLQQIGSTDGHLYLELVWDGQLYGSRYKKWDRGLL